MEVKIEESWKKILADEFEKPYFAELAGFALAELRWGWEETLRAPLAALILARRHRRRAFGRPGG